MSMNTRELLNEICYRLECIHCKRHPLHKGTCKGRPAHIDACLGFEDVKEDKH